jgi:hypothetical protein
MHYNNVPLVIMQPLYIKILMTKNDICCCERLTYIIFMQDIIQSIFSVISNVDLKSLLNISVISFRGFISIIWYKTCLIILGFVNVILLVIWNKLNSYKYCYLRNQWEMQQIWHVDLLVGWVISTTNDSKIWRNNNLF